MNKSNCLDPLSEMDLNFYTLQEYMKSNFDIDDMMDFEETLNLDEYSSMSKLQLINHYQNKTMCLWQGLSMKMVIQVLNPKIREH